MSFRSYDLLKLVEDHGQSLTLRKITTEGSYNPSTGSTTGSATTDYAFQGYFYNNQAGINAEDIRRGKRKCLISALSLLIPPDDEDIIIGNGDNVAVTHVMTIFSDGTAICYICETAE